MRNLKIMGWLIVVVILSACGGDDGDPVPTQTTAAIQPTQPPVVTQVVTVAPRPTQVPTATATLPYDIRFLEGAWNLILNLTTRSADMVGTIHYSTSAAVTITSSGEVSGEGRFTKYVEYAECPVEVQNGEAGQPFTVQGQLVPTGDGTNAHLELTLVPIARDELERFSIRCFQGDVQSNTPVETRVLWPALEANDLLNFTFDMSQQYYSAPIQEETVTGDLYFGR